MENPSHQSDSSSSSSSEDEDIKSKVTRVLKKRLVVLLLQLLRDSSIDKERVSTSSFTGSLFIQEVLNGSSSICYELCEWKSMDLFLYVTCLEKKDGLLKANI